jgi:hypothetical protein
MSNLFGGKPKVEVGAPPTVDVARGRVEALKRGQTMKGRASAMLVQGQQASPTAQRQVTGN